ncbi:MAG: hypothetical protein ACO3MW_00510 [Rhodospirillales bacterium]
MKTKAVTMMCLMNPMMKESSFAPREDRVRARTLLSADLLALLAGDLRLSCP